MSQTDGRTDGRHAIARPRFALGLYIVHRAVKSSEISKQKRLTDVGQLYLKQLALSAKTVIERMHISHVGQDDAECIVV